jgi:hypothetical protein
VSSVKKDPLRALTSSERNALERLARSQSAPAASVARARAFLAVSDGSSYTEAAQLVGRVVGDSIAQWVARFNQVGPQWSRCTVVVHHLCRTAQPNAIGS